MQAAQEWGGQFAIELKSMKEVGWTCQTTLLVCTSLIGPFSRRRPSMAGIDLSPFWSHSLCEFRFNRCARILLPDMAAYNSLPQAVGAETVSPNSLLNLMKILTAWQHYPRTIHGSYICHRLFSILPLLLACHLL